MPQLKHINFISNGFFTDKILAGLSDIRKLCKKKNIGVDISISVDGIGGVQDFHRGHKDAFVNADNTIRAILKEKECLVDSINVICTITRYNIAEINEVEEWSKNLGINVAYNIATENVRIENQERVNDFSVFSDEQSRMLAQEFFYRKYIEENSERYFAIFLFLKTGRRYDICPCIYNNWVTLTPDCQLGFCATHSKNLGNGLEISPLEIIKSNISYLDEIKHQYCSTCSHYMYGLNYEGLKHMQEDKMNNYFFRG